MNPMSFQEGINSKYNANHLMRLVMLVGNIQWNPGFYEPPRETKILVQGVRRFKKRRLNKLDFHHSCLD